MAVGDDEDDVLVRLALAIAKRLAELVNFRELDDIRLVGAVIVSFPEVPKIVFIFGLLNGFKLRTNDELLLIVFILFVVSDNIDPLI